MDNLKERLLQFIDYKGIKVQSFERAVGLSNASVAKMGNNTRRSTIDKISNTYPDLNTNWLLTGEGKMLNVSASESNILSSDSIFPDSNEEDTSLEPLQVAFSRSHYQPIYDIRVCAGQGIGLDGNENKILKWVAIPDFRGCQGMMVFGDSMYDKYKSGDVVFFRQVFNRDQIENGQPYIVITREDRLLKLIYDEGDPDYITLVSYNVCTNPDGRRTYPDMKIPKKDILFLYKIVGRLERSQI